jgi:hypothetical protein
VLLGDDAGSRGQHVPMLVREHLQPRGGRRKAVRLVDAGDRGDEQGMQSGQVVVNRGAKIHGRRR